MVNGKAETVADVPSGQCCVVSQLRGGDEFNHRMVIMGFTPGTDVTVIQNYGRGPIIVSVRNTRIALGRGEAHKVLVETV